MDWYEDEVRMLEREREADPGPADPVAFYGSSSIRLWDDIAADLGDPRIVNLGFGGSTLAACAHYFGRVVVPYRPRSVVVYAGDNDLGDGRSTPRSSTSSASSTPASARSPSPSSRSSPAPRGGR